MTEEKALELGAQRGVQQGTEENLDVLLHWNDDIPAAPRPEGDSVDLGEAEVEAAAVEATVRGAMPVPEIFEYTRERDAAIEAALRGMAESPVARVHAQLERIREALEARALPAERATALLDEVDAYLAGHIKTRTGRPPVDDERITGARATVADALHLFGDVSQMLRQYLESQSPGDLILAQRLGDQAASFLFTARHALLDAAPEPEAAEESPTVE
ncbi:MAG: hypothetical protein FJX76_20780 [Armatimonadetes bacterium]|nr:hypothetical protein [Armatimonadota bacterium]